MHGSMNINISNTLVYHILLPTTEWWNNYIFIHYSSQIIILEWRCRVLMLSAATEHAHSYWTSTHEGKWTYGLQRSVCQKP